MNTLVSATDSDSSSDDEAEKQKILEAVVNSTDLQAKTQYKHDGMSVKSESTSNDADKKTSGTEKRMNLPSLRPSCTDSDRGDNELNTTPEFRNFVAKKLQQMLDRELETRLDVVERVDKQDRGVDSEGIKLLRQSKKKLTTDCYYDEDVNRNQAPVRKRPNLLKKRRLASSSDSSDEEKRLAEAAVSCDFIMQQSRGVLCRTDQSSKSEANDDEDCDRSGDSRITNSGDESKTVSSDANVVLNDPPHKKKKKKKHKHTKEIKSS